MLPCTVTVAAFACTASASEEPISAVSVASSPNSSSADSLKAQALKSKAPTFDISGSYRLRYEHLNNPIFPSSSEDRAQVNRRVSSRLLVKAQANWDVFNATLELADSRVWLDDNDPTLTSSQVNTLEPLQFFVRYTPQDSQYLKGITAGRITFDHGSRRLIGQGVYRNTKNAFDGVLVDYQVSDWNIRGFYLLPVSRLPSDSGAVADAERAFDKSYSEREFFGLYITSPDNNVKLQSYWLKEEDSAKLSTKNRDLYTLSVDYTKPFADTWKANIEVIGQTGTSRQTASASDTTELDVESWLLHANIGKKITDYTFLRGEIDAISGDNDSSDNTISDFDSLYGVRRFDFGPTDVYQAMPRRNLYTVGARSVTKPSKEHNIMVSYKAMWYQKAPESVDNFIGQQLEARWRWQIMPSLRLAIGAAYLLKGDGFERGDYPDDSQFVFTGALYTF
ncbi:alginate export family protein [Alteromonas stellipolaris]|uniref:alginate export family protein n=1 Tax=Alteromonas stellipolaris TaxID=233316 RepID=UPI0027334812|nr:alginate export family protein [Alteromonas stellipolaris]MDP2598063.1 alginate export family protein [Alteromonas stellipolaris]